MTPHEYACHVRFSDVDVYGHVNNVKYFEYYQEARLAYLVSLAAADPAASGEPGGPSGLVVARVDVDYRRPVLFRPEPYAVRTWVSRVGTSSFGLEAEIRDGDVLLSKAAAVMVAFDRERQASRPLTAQERQRLEAAVRR